MKSQSIRLVVRPKFKTNLKKSAEQHGVNMSTYIKMAVINYQSQSFPEYEPSQQTIKAIKDSFKEKGVSTNGRKASTVLREIVK